MAGIEKVCEYSGEYPGRLMYGYKRNHIQVVPKYRKDFRGKFHILYIEKNPAQLQMFYRGNRNVYSSFDTLDQQNYTMVYNGSLYCNRTCRSVRLVKEYTYMLYVPSMLGRVEGCYINYTTELGSLKRRLKRMLRCKKLNIVYVNDVDEVYDDIHLKNNLIGEK